MASANTEYQRQIETVSRLIEECDAIVVGGASGMSTANQHDFYGYSKYFREHFSDFQRAYGLRSLCDALYYRYQSCEERWAYFAKHGSLMFDQAPGRTYVDLHALIADKNYFIVTTNQDMQFAKLFPQERICYPQGSSHWLQCGAACHDEVYPSEEVVRRLAGQVFDTRLPSSSVPKCAHCGAVMEPWIRAPTFLEGEFWQEGMDRYGRFLQENHRKKVLLIELGVGSMTPNIIKHPFNAAVLHWPETFLVRINLGEAPVHPIIAGKSIVMDADIAKVLSDLRQCTHEAHANAVATVGVQ
ncbi:SIR2 family NAD-dependent protein deacylase [Stenotrophomonas maltophilia]|uniref:NAD-dependent protein deacetylase n=1 Tax=Stenotrophomonas maltophilia TaxID=40324 RepID=A0A246IDB5_STEMA|nr:NAD-dependent protein deacetylase [Stenotrophomonas maltophilia]OWQ78012.1 NAD-dependent protein deacetylase [Stenotrophomonas maltophilia]